MSRLKKFVIVRVGSMRNQAVIPGHGSVAYKNLNDELAKELYDAGSEQVVLSKSHAKDLFGHLSAPRLIAVIMRTKRPEDVDTIASLKPRTKSVQGAKQKRLKRLGSI